MSRIVCGEFELVAPIGQGGMGQVWAGRHRASQIDVAVKVLHPEVSANPEYRQTFEAELRAVAALDHPNIVTLLDYGTISASTARQSGDQLQAGCPYLVMEYARGGALIDHVNRLAWVETKAVLLRMLDALSHAHARGLIHRDLKPENVLVGCGASWALKLTDFGLVHVDTRFDEKGKVGKVWGTPQYMAPEQLRGFWRDYGPWTDLYGLGCMAFELVCGHWPFEGDTPWKIAARHLKAPVPAISPRFAVPEGLQMWLEKMLAKRTCDRFQRAADAAWELSKLCLPGEGAPRGPLFEPLASSGRGEASAQVTPREASTTLILSQLQAGATLRSPSARLEIGEWEEQLGAPNDVSKEVPAGPPLPLSWRRSQERGLSNDLLGISLGLFGLRAIPLVDREEERDKLWRLLHEVHSSGSARQALIAGGAGTGKSELARWLVERAEEVGAAIALEAWHHPVMGPRDGIAPMLSRHLGCVHLSLDDALSRLERICAPLGVDDPYLLRGLAQLVATRQTEGRDVPSVRVATQHDRLSTIYVYLKHLARTRPVLLWLDDVAWGQEALALAHYIAEAQAREPAPILVVMTVRSEALAQRRVERIRLRELEAQGLRRLELQALEDADAEALVRELLHLDEDLARHVLQRVDGVPLFAVQLVEDWVSQGKLVMGRQGFVLRPGADVTIPDDVHALWDERVRGFAAVGEGPTLEQLEAAATLGVIVDADELRALSEHLGLPPVDALVPRLIDAGLARARAQGWSFVHGLLQESLERSARDGGRWMRLNLAAAGVLGQRYALDAPGVAERVAWHCHEGGRADLALAPLRGAVAQAIQGSDYVHAEELISWRESLSEEVAERAAERAALTSLVDRAWLAAARADFAACRTLAETVRGQAAQRGYVVEAAEAAIWAGVAARHAGELERAQALLKEARDVFKGREASAALARVELEGGRVAELAGDLDAAHKRLERARRAYARLGDAYGQARALNALGDVARQAGDITASSQATLQALRLFESIGNVSGVADCLNDLAERSRLQGQWELARERAEEALRLYKALDSYEQYGVRLNLAMIAYHRGDAEEALRLGARLDEAFMRAGQAAPHAQLLALRLAAYARLGRWDEVLVTLKRKDAMVHETALRAFGVDDFLEDAARYASVQELPRVLEALNDLVVQLRARGAAGEVVDASLASDRS
ncbi:hypothetical protein DL240_03350 [Lujinxingia litoralis]|uniref:Protein kinase domain-containing protein n=1 Tax=Lujinxingia litoralis TaxID=2211119 RepID=A0A328CD52_9DELT|nr:serine/threonine-protein kinase [Lujinxingia litoralis]RAL25261.1 hypothetical protein DL240_03350 [Lujinxingia litoralis]